MTILYPSSSNPETLTVEPDMILVPGGGSSHVPVKFHTPARRMSLTDGMVVSAIPPLNTR